MLEACQGSLEEGMAVIGELGADPVAVAATAVSAAAREMATRAKEKCQEATPGPSSPLSEGADKVIVPNFCTPLTAMQCDASGPLF
jgi:hypothetical protein